MIFINVFGETKNSSADVAVARIKLEAFLNGYSKSHSYKTIFYSSKMAISVVYFEQQTAILFQVYEGEWTTIFEGKFSDSKINEAIKVFLELAEEIALRVEAGWCASVTTYGRHFSHYISGYTINLYDPKTQQTARFMSCLGRKYSLLSSIEKSIKNIQKVPLSPSQPEITIHHRLSLQKAEDLGQQAENRLLLDQAVKQYPELDTDTLLSLIEDAHKIIEDTQSKRLEQAYKNKTVSQGKTGKKKHSKGK
jgi:hypothetical protein